MPFKIKITPATITALATLVQVLDKHRFGAVMLVLIFVAVSVLMAVPYFPIQIV